MNRDQFEGYSTKYALTVGIQKLTLESCSDSMVKARGPQSLEFLHGEGKDWHRTWESAVNCAEKMRINKIKSLEKSLKKIRGIKWEQPIPLPQSH